MGKAIKTKAMIYNVNPRRLLRILRETFSIVGPDVVWKNSNFGRIEHSAGDIAGGLKLAKSHPPGYRSLSLQVDGRRIHISAQRVAWMLANAKTLAPTVFVDHLDGNTLNNRPSNLRVASTAVNARNRTHADARSVTGLMNVSRRYNKWYGRFKFGEVRHCTPSFDTATSAVLALWRLKYKCEPAMRKHWATYRKQQLELARTIDTGGTPHDPNEIARVKAMHKKALVLEAQPKTKTGKPSKPSKPSNSKRK